MQNIEQSSRRRTFSAISVPDTDCRALSAGVSGLINKEGHYHERRKFFPVMLIWLRNESCKGFIGPQKDNEEREIVMGLTEKWCQAGNQREICEDLNEARKKGPI